MNIEKIESKKNPVLKRMEGTAHLSFTGVTPSEAEVRKGIAQKLGADEARVVINRIATKYGGGGATVSLYVYEDDAAQAKVEPRKKAAKGAEAKEAAA